MSHVLSVCGCDCSACEHLKIGTCAGCSAIKGKVWWAHYVSADTCPIYRCVSEEKKVRHCGMCSQLPCNLWRDLKDPTYSDEQHDAGIRERVERLRDKARDSHE